MTMLAAPVTPAPFDGRAPVRPFDVMPRLTDGGTIAILAPGPSLTVADADYVRPKVDAVIALSEAWKAAPWCAVLYSSDKGFWLRHLSQVKPLAAIKVRVHTTGDKPTARPIDKRDCARCRLRLPASGVCWCVRAELLTLRNGGVAGLSLAPDTICTGNNSGTAALNVALLAGATRIILLGYNMGLQDGRRYFSDREPRSTSSPFEQFIKFTTAMAPLLRNAGVEVINCSRVTALECFARRPLREVL